MDLNAPIKEGYFPKLDTISSSKVWGSRAQNSIPRDIYRPEAKVKVDIVDLERWRDRIYEVAVTGKFIDEKGDTIELSEENGIDDLGNLVAASTLSRNKNLYGDLHNAGHIIIAYIHDPDFRHLVSTFRR